ncbi:MAG: DUF2062 domain-containing protein [bacterium]|nr:DUF2062 domain-containing protein [bacterium]
MNLKPDNLQAGAPNPKLRFRPGRFFRYLYLRLIRANDSPHKAAMGMALGVALGIFPTFGAGAILAIVLASLFKWNKASALLGSMIMNPFTTPFVWSASALLGSFLTGYDWGMVLEELKNGAMFDVMSASCRVYLLGNTVLALLIAGVSYIVVFRIVNLSRKTRKRP